MSRRAKRNNKGVEQVTPPTRVLDRPSGAEDQTEGGLPRDYWQACKLAEQGKYDEARQLYSKLAHSAVGVSLGALVQNDLAVLAALEGRFDEAQQGWQHALELDRSCLMARLNRDLVQAELDVADHDDGVGLSLVPPPVAPQQRPTNDGPIKVAILSFLFNWPSTGGGNMHTAGLVDFLARAGYEVRHFYARYPEWGIGRASDPLVASEAIEFDANGWNVAEIQARYRSAVDRFQPDYVAITDTWNMKPLLAEAMRDYPCLLLYQALENLCPLNNLRLLADGPGQVRQCPRNQLATPEVCHRCLAERGYHSGALHQCERAMAWVGTTEYDQNLRRSLQEAEAVLAINPFTAAMLEPYASRVCVVPWGLDPARFPWPVPDRPPGQKMVLFMAAVAGETIKGFHVAHEACRLLRQTRNDFELVVTFEPPGPGPIDEFSALGRLVLAGRAASTLPGCGCLPRTNDRPGWAEHHVGRGDGQRHPGGRQPDRRRAVYRQRWSDRATFRTGQLRRHGAADRPAAGRSCVATTDGIGRTPAVRSRLHLAHRDRTSLAATAAAENFKCV